MNSKTLGQFLIDYKELKEKYPMVTFDAWTPEDYAYIIADIKGNEEPTEIKWDDELYGRIANTLMLQYDAESGLNNDLVRETITDIVGSEG